MGIDILLLRKATFLFVIFLINTGIGNFLFSQTKITGIVKDSSNSTISFVNIYVKEQKSQIIKSFTQTNINGFYEVIIQDSGIYEINFAAFSYSPQKIKIDFDKGAEQIINVTLINENIELNEVVIKATRSITFKSDTTVFDATSFIKGDEQVVEDLLKRIPGLNISNDGIIRVGLQAVEKVMVDGEDFFDKGYKILTKNMPVSPINKIELYHHYSNNKHLKGIENSDKVAINLTLKDDVKKNWFGNLQGGYGLEFENRFELKNNLMKFGKKNKYYFLFNLNNIGVDPTGDIDHLVYPNNSDESTNFGDNQKTNTAINLTPSKPYLKSERLNFNNEKLFSLNSVFTLSPKLKLKTLVFYNFDEMEFSYYHSQSIKVGTIAFENFENQKLNKSPITGFSKFDFIYEFSKTKTLEATSKINIKNSKIKNDILFNGYSLTEKLDTKNESINQKIVFTSELSSSKVLIATANFINENEPQKYITNQYLLNELFGNSANNYEQFISNTIKFMGLEGHFFDKKSNGNIFEFQFGNQYRMDKLNSRFIIKRDSVLIDVPSNFQSKTDFSTNDLFSKFKYLIDIKKLILFSQLDFHFLSNNLWFSENRQNQRLEYINPKLGFKLDLNSKNKLKSFYSLNKTNSTVLDVNNKYIYSSFRSFEKGTETFNQLDNSNWSLNYTYGNWGESFYINSNIAYIRSHDFFSYNLLLDKNFTKSDKILLKNKALLTFSSSFDNYFKSIESNLKLVLDVSKLSYKNKINNSDLREIQAKSVDYGFELSSGSLFAINYHIGSKWNINKTTTKETNTFSSNLSFVDLSINFNKKCNIQFQTERYYFGNLEKSNNKYYFLDLESRYTIIENKLTLYLSGKNLTNTKAFKDYYIDDISISKTEYKLLPRYTLLKIDYRF